MNTSNMQRPGAAKKKRTGLFKALIGSRHIIKGPDGKNRSFTVKEKMRHSRAKMVCVCLLCKKTWPDEAELIAAHPETTTMRKQEEAHVYAWWSEDAIVPVEVKADKDTKKPLDPMNIIGLLSDEEL